VIFGPTRLADARGAILAHTQRLPDRVIKKGFALDDAAIAALHAAGHETVIAARLEPGDVPEDAAAERLGIALTAAGFTRSRATTGRLNLFAERAGVLRIDAARINALNALDEALTVGTLPDFSVVDPKEMIATIKIIPFAVPGAILDAAEILAHQAPPAFTLHEFSPLRVGLVLSQLPGMKPSILDGTVEVTQARIEALGGTLLPARRCAHTEAAIEAELRALLDAGADLLLVAGASAVVDRHDVGPMAIIRAGGDIQHFGMPVDPGNLICLGHIGHRPALVLPGCARSPKLNGIDWVLSRLFAGLAVTGADIAGLGVGGLLKDVDARPQPRAKGQHAVAGAARHRPGIAAVVMAAGRSRRMAPRNKLLVPVGAGELMIQRVVRQVRASRAGPVLVVTGHQHGDIEAALTGQPVRFVHADDFAEGLAASLKAGIAAVPADCAAAIVCLGDMPLVSTAMLDRLIEAYDPEEGRTIIMPVFDGRRGNPVLWDRRYFADIAALTGDLGARHLLHEHAADIAEVAMDDDAVLRDFDTVDTLTVFDT
jgi:molybdenum cofactor cytidylyltransferase